MTTPQIIGVVGQMRSGTSLVAQTIHLLGITMGRTFIAPVAPTYRFEWEDTELSLIMGKVWMHGEPPIGGLAPWWKRYLDLRKRHASQVTGSPRFGFKSPPWVLVGDTLLPDAQKLGSIALIHVDRTQAAIDHSVSQSFPDGWVEKALSANAKIREKISDLPRDYTAAYETFIYDPERAVKELADFLGIEDRTRIEHAISEVREDRQWPQSQPSSSVAEPQPPSAEAT